MDIKTLELIIKKSLNTFETINFIWHGGEPLTAGIPYFKEIVKFQEKHKNNYNNILNSVQTNATLINDEWMHFFSKNNFNIGVSLDGPETIHDSNRIFKNNTRSHKAVLSGIRLIEKYTGRVGTISVITKNTLNCDPNHFLDFFIQNNIKEISLNWQKPKLNLNELDGLSKDDYSEFIKKLFDVWYKNNRSNIRIREFNAIIDLLLSKKTNFCILAGNCIGKYFGIDFKGNVYHCDEFMFDEKYNLGNIHESSFDNIINNNRLTTLVNNNIINLSHLDCKWKTVCNGGCPKDRYVFDIQNNGRTVSCCGWSEIIDHINNTLNNSLSEILNC